MANGKTNKIVKGVDASNEVDHNKSYRDTRSGRQKFQDFMGGEGGVIVAITISLVVFTDVFFAMLKGAAFGSTVWLIIALPFLNKLSKRFYQLPFKKPKSTGEIDPNQLNPADDSASPAAGITFFGNDSVNDEQIWFANDDVRIHCLIFGTTGAGKTEALLSICMNSLIHSSGFIYVDGKGDNSLFLKVFSMVRRMGREDDLLLINYMTGKTDVSKKSFNKLSNTMNPFSDGSHDGLSELVVSLLPGGGDGMWKGRAAVFMAALMRVLVYLRDEKKITLDINVIRKHFSLEQLENLIAREDIPLDKLDGLQDYVWNLPGYKKPDPSKPDEVIEQEYGVFEQHGFITMQYTEVFGMLSDTYGHIMKTQLAEVDFFDVVVNRRFLVVLLPALEKSQQSLGNLGKIIVSSVKSMMSSALGSAVEGKREDVVEAKPTNAPSPYVTVFDEYGYYAVEGAAVMPAQARSLGFSMIFAGQDYQAFKKGSADEAASIIANCGIKICMKLEDPTETLDIFTKAAGSATVEKSGGMQINKDSTTGGYSDSGNTNLTSMQRIDVRDLKGQGPGEGHILFGDTFIRAKMFYANPHQVYEQRINKFLKVPMPEYHKIRRLTLGYNKIYRSYNAFLSPSSEEQRKEADSFINANNGSDLKLVINKFKKTEKKGTLQERSIVALYAHIKKQKQIDCQLNDDVDAYEALDYVENEYVPNKEEVKKTTKKREVEESPFAEEPNFEENSVRDQVSGSYKEATKNRKIVSDKTKSGTDKLRESLQKTHNIIEGNHNKYNPYKPMGLDAPDLQKKMQSLENKLTQSYNNRGILDDNSRLDEGYSEMATEKVITEIGLGTSCHNEVKIQKMEHNKQLLSDIIDDIILTKID